MHFLFQSSIIEHHCIYDMLHIHSVEVFVGEWPSLVLFRLNNEPGYLSIVTLLSIRELKVKDHSCSLLLKTSVN